VKLKDIKKNEKAFQEIPLESIESNEKETSKYSKKKYLSPLKPQFTKVIGSSKVNSKFSIKEFKTNLYRLISTFYIAKKFITNLRNSTIYRNPKYLKSFHFEVINDWSFSLQGYNIENQTFKCIRCFKIFQKILTLLMFHPHHLFRILFDIMILIMTYFYFIAIPIEISFNVDFLNFCLLDYNGIIGPIKFIIFMIFVLEIFLNFNTAILIRGEFITDRTKIFKKYLTNQFIWDFFSLIYFVYSGYFKQYTENQTIHVFFSLIFFLRLLKISKTVNQIEEPFFLDESTYNKINFIKLIFAVFLVAHFSACIWHSIGFSLKDTENTWLQDQGIINEVWYKKYITSLYYVVVVMNTIGFGDIVSKNYYEKIFNIFFIYIGCSVFAYMFNSIGIILQNINKKDRDFKTKMYVINGYMKEKNVNFQLRSKIRNYFEYLRQEEKVANTDEANKIINNLSTSLKNELILCSHFDLLKNIPFFYQNFSEHTLKTLNHEMKEINFTPGDIIYNQHDINDPNLYIIRNGSVEAFVNHEIKNQPLTILQTFQVGELFGQISFLTNQPQETSVRSCTFTTLFVIQKENFMNIIKKNDYDFQIFCQIKDQINFNNDHKKLYLSCASCHNSDHSTRNCPMFNVETSKKRVIDKHNYSIFQERSDYKRKFKKKFHPLTNLKSLETLKVLANQKNNEDSFFCDNEGTESLTNDQIFDFDNSQSESTKKKSKDFSDENKEINREFLENMEPSSSHLRGNVCPSPKLSPNNAILDAFSEKKKLNYVLDKKNDELKFESMKEYNFYYPKNNFEDFIDKYNAISFKRMLKNLALSKKMISESDLHFQKRHKAKKFKYQFDVPLYRKIDKNNAFSMNADSPNILKKNQANKIKITKKKKSDDHRKGKKKSEKLRIA